jgi:hypothetical protein
MEAQDTQAYTSRCGEVTECKRHDGYIVQGSHETRSGNGEEADLVHVNCEED